MSAGLFDHVIDLNHYLWVMSDDDFDELMVMAKIQRSLVNEHINPTTTMQCKQEIIKEIESLRLVRNTIINRYQ